VTHCALSLSKGCAQNLSKGARSGASTSSARICICVLSLSKGTIRRLVKLGAHSPERVYVP
jgi:hypothetical protein